MTDEELQEWKDARRNLSDSIKNMNHSIEHALETIRNLKQGYLANQNYEMLAGMRDLEKKVLECKEVYDNNFKG